MDDTPPSGAARAWGQEWKKAEMSQSMLDPITIPIPNACSLSSQPHMSGRREQTVLLAAHTKAAKTAVLQYFAFSVMTSIRVPLLLTCVSNVLALVAWHYASGHRELQAWLELHVWGAAHKVLDVIIKGYLGSLVAFFSGFTLSNAFNRYSKGLELMQQLSLQLRVGVDEALSVLAKSDASEWDHATVRARELAAWVKVYFIHACRGLNSVTLRAERRELRRTMQGWDKLLQHSVNISSAAAHAMQAHSDIFVSTLQMELLWWRWLDPILQNGQAGASDLAEAKKWFDAARKSFHSAHMLASGITASPVTLWLMAAVMYLNCLVLPWMLVRTFGILCFLPTLFTTFILFGAQQVGNDLWQPFGIGNQGVVNVELYARAEALCEQLDNMLALFDDGHFCPKVASGCPHFTLIVD